MTRPRPAAARPNRRVADEPTASAGPEAVPVPAARLTVIWTNGGYANKSVTRRPDGSLTKAPAPFLKLYKARTVTVRSLAELRDLLLGVGGKAGHTLSLGVFDIADGETFYVMSKAELAWRLGVPETSPTLAGWHDLRGFEHPVVARSQVNMSRGGLVGFDYDDAAGMPPELTGLSFDAWRAGMAALHPPFAEAGFVVLPSTTNRILLDQKPAYGAKANFHAFAFAADPAGLEAELGHVWPQLIVRAFGVNLPGTEVPMGFMKPSFASDGSGRVIGRAHWSIFDRTTRTVERLWFDGAPTVRGDGLSVAPPEARVIPGGALDLASFADLTAPEIVPARRQGVRLEKKKRASGAAGTAADHLVVDALKLDTEIRVGGGTLTIRDYWLSGDGHTRCEAPFRPQSTSEAAFLNRHADGSPFVYDSGAGPAKYVLAGADRVGPPPEDFVDALRAFVAGRTVAAGEVKAVFERVRLVGAAAARHDRSDPELGALAAALAVELAAPLGQSRSRLSRSLAAELKQAAKATWKACGDGLAPDAGEDDRLLEELNAKYCVVRIGGKVRICEPDARDPNLKRRHAVMMSIPDFQALLADRTLPVPSRDGVKEVPAASWWIHHPGRRAYPDGVTLDPSGADDGTALNLWRGFGVEPVDGDPGPLLDHVLFCARGNGPGADDYLVDWLAHKVQHPAAAAGTAVVMRGPEGCGKGTVGRAGLRIFGPHGMTVSNPEHVAGKVNAHLLDRCFLFADEAFHPTDKKHVSVLKTLITEEFIAIEPKGVDTFQAVNRIGLMLASNLDWVVPASFEARRFFVIDVPKDRIGDRRYFKRLADAVQNKDGMLGRFLNFLLARDLSGFEIRDIPQTAALADQKLHSLGREEAWLLRLLHRGRLEDDFTPWKEFYTTEVLHADYERYMRSKGAALHALNLATFGRFLRRFAAAARPRAGDAGADGKRTPGGKAGADKPRPTGYRFGPLEEARARFAAAVGAPIEWPEGGVGDDSAAAVIPITKGNREYFR